MKYLIMILAMTTKAMAFKQIYAINAGGKAHTDSDGIIYKGSTATQTYQWSGKLDFGSVPDPDRHIYKFIDFTRSPKLPIKHDITMNNDGHYVLIVKLSNDICGHEGKSQSMTLNYKIDIFSKVDLHQICGGEGKICDKYFYFYVSNKVLYYKNKSSDIENEKIHFEIRSDQDNGFAYLAGLVLLKGTLGERVKLNSSATNETVFFDPIKLNPKCATTENVFNELQKILELKMQTTKELQTNMEYMIENSIKNVSNLCAESKLALDRVQEANENFQQQHSTESNKIQAGIDRCCENSLKNISNMKDVINSSFEGHQKTNENILSVVKSLQQQQSDNNNQLQRWSESNLNNFSNLTATIQSSNEGLQAASVNTKDAIEKLEKNLNDSVSQFHKKQNNASDRFAEFEQKMIKIVSSNGQCSNAVSFNKPSILTSASQSLFEQTQADILREVKSLQNMDRMEQQISKCIDIKELKSAIEVAHKILTQKMDIQNQPTEQMAIKFEKLQSDLTIHASKSDKANKMLQAGMRQLSADSQRLQAENQKKFDKMALELASLKAQNTEISNQLNEIRDAVLSIARKD